MSKPNITLLDDKSLRQILHDCKGSIKQGERYIYLVGLLSVVLFGALLYFHLFSLPLCVCTLVLVVLAMLTTFILHRPLHQIDMLTAPLDRVTATFDTYGKRFGCFVRWISPIVLLPWAVWCCYEAAFIRFFGGHSWTLVIFCLTVIGCGYLCIISTYRYPSLAKSLVRQLKNRG